MITIVSNHKKNKNMQKKKHLVCEKKTDSKNIKRVVLENKI